MSEPMRPSLSRAVDVGDAGIRVGTQDDVPALRRIDDLAFPLSNPYAQRAAPGEIEDGVAAGDIYVFDRRGEPVAYVHIDRRREDLVYVSGIAVHPDVQGQGLGSWMIDYFLESMGSARDEVPVVTITSPRNVVMLRTLFRRNFAARWVLRDHFGPGKDRFLCQLHSPGWGPSTTPPHWVSADDLGTVLRLVDEGFVVRSFRWADGLPEFEVVSPAIDFLPFSCPDLSP
jgi:GNAT superfamily N-acetyltransferase